MQQRKEALGSLWMHRMPTYRARIQQICAAALRLPVSAQPFRCVLQLLHITRSPCMIHANTEYSAATVPVFKRPQGLQTCWCAVPGTCRTSANALMHSVWHLWQAN